MMRPLVYDWATFTLSNGASDYDVATEQSALFSNVPVAKNIVVFFNKQVGIRFNSTLMPKATLRLQDSPFQSPERWLATKNIFLSNASGQDATIIIWLW